MFVWWDVIFMRFVHDPLLAGRLVSVACGVITIIGLFLLGRDVFKNKWVGLITAGLGVIYPFALVYDRMALYDSMVGTFTIWSLYLMVLQARRPRAWIAFLLGLILGGGMLTKTSAFFSWYLLPATLLLFDWSEEKRITRLSKWVAFSVLSVGLANLYYSVLRLSPFFHIISDKNAIFVYPLSEWIHHPLSFLQGNLSGLWNWFTAYFSYPILLILIAGLFIYRKYTKEKIVLITYFFVPFILLAFFGRILYPRFIYFMTLPLLPIVALLLLWLYRKVGKWQWFVLSVVILFALWLRSDFLIITDFEHAPIADSDSNQYINGWPSGSGIKETMAFLTNQAENKKIFVLSEGTFGSLPTYAVEIYLGDNRNVEKMGIWPIPDHIPSDIEKKAKTMDVYVIFYQQKAPPLWPVNLIASYKKGLSKSYLYLYKVKVL